MKYVLVACSVAALAFSCGSSVDSNDQTGGASSVGGHGGAGGQGGDGGGPVARKPAVCHDQIIKDMLGKRGAQEGEECASNNGCGGCTVVCKDGTWTNDGPLCYSIGAAC